MTLFFRSPSVMMPLLNWPSTSTIFFRVSLTMSFFDSGMIMSSIPIEMPAWNAVVKPSSFSLSSTSTVTRSPAAL